MCGHVSKCRMRARGEPIERSKTIWYAFPERLVPFRAGEKVERSTYSGFWGAKTTYYCTYTRRAALAALST